MKRLAFLILSTLPGAAHVYFGRVWVGFGTMIAGFVSWELVWLGSSGLWGSSSFNHLLAWLIALGTLAYSWSWTWRETSPAFVRRRAKATDSALREAQRAYLRRQLSEAQGAVTQGLRYDRTDPDLLFFGWRVAIERHDHSLARSLARRLRRADEDCKWLWQLEQEEARYEQV